MLVACGSTDVLVSTERADQIGSVFSADTTAPTDPTTTDPTNATEPTPDPTTTEPSRNTPLDPIDPSGPMGDPDVPQIDPTAADPPSNQSVTRRQSHGGVA